MRAIIRQLSPDDDQIFVPYGYKTAEKSFWDGASIIRLDADTAVVISAAGSARVMRFISHVNVANVEQSIHVVSDELDSR